MAQVVATAAVIPLAGSGNVEIRNTTPDMGIGDLRESGMRPCLDERALATTELGNGKNVRSLSPPSGAPRRIGAIADIDECEVTPSHRK
jgi:hypothetical protein